MKKLLLTLAVCVVAVAAIETASSYVLFRFYSWKQVPFTPNGSATAFLLDKALTRPQGRTLTVEPSPLYRLDKTLGYTTIPAVYRVLEGWRALHDFRITVPEAGTRATSYRPVTAGPSIYILGSSLAFGWGIDDELTFPWLLQARLPNYRVVNMSMTGYSDVHMMLQYEALLPKLQPDDLVIMAYGGYLAPDVAAPSWLRAQSDGYEMALGQKGITSARMPYATLQGGKLAVAYMTIFCANNHGQCARPDPSPATMAEIGRRIYAHVLALPHDRLVIAFLAGKDDDPVIAYVRARGAKVLDLRLESGAPDYDDTIALDRHPGAFKHFSFYCALLDGLARQHLVEVPPVVEPAGGVQAEGAAPCVMQDAAISR